MRHRHVTPPGQARRFRNHHGRSGRWLLRFCAVRSCGALRGRCTRSYADRHRRVREDDTRPVVRNLPLGDDFGAHLKLVLTYQEVAARTGQKSQLHAKKASAKCFFAEVRNGIPGTHAGRWVVGHGCAALIKIRLVHMERDDCGAPSSSCHAQREKFAGHRCRSTCRAHHIHETPSRQRRSSGCSRVFVHRPAHANGSSLSSIHRPCTCAVARKGRITRATSPSSRRCASAMISSERISA